MVYIDRLNYEGKIDDRFKGTFCRLTADSEPELHEFAARCGIIYHVFAPGRNRVYTIAGTGIEISKACYLVNRPLRNAALKRGAIEL